VIVAHAGRGVQVDVRDFAARLGEAVGHPDGDGLLQPEHVAEVLGERAEHRQLGRAGVAEDRRHPVLAEQLERRVAHGRHCGDLPSHIGARLPVAGVSTPANGRKQTRAGTERSTRAGH